MTSAKAMYDLCVSERQNYLTTAEALATITLPDLLAPYNVSRYTITNRPANGSQGINAESPYNSAGTQAITGLASSLQNLMFPSNIEWFRLTLTSEMENNLLAQGIAQQDIDNALTAQSKSIKNFLTSINLQSSVGQIFNRLLVEDNVLVVVTEQGIRSIPMRNCGIKRIGNQLIKVSWFESIPDEKGNEQKIYYYVDYDKGEVWRQADGEQKSRRVRLSPKQIFVVSGSIPDTGSYVASYGSRYYGMIYTINQLSYHMLRAASIAAKSILFIDENSGLTPQQVVSLQGGQAIVGNAAALTWLDSAQKINDWQFVSAYMEELKNQLARAFALDILNFQPMGAQPKTATEVQAIGQAIDARIASMAQTVQLTFVKNLIEAVMAILASKGISPDLFANVTPVVTSGTSALDRQLEYQKLLQGLSVLAQFDPTLAQRIDSLKLLETFSAVTNIDTSTYIRPAPQQVQMAPQPQPIQQPMI